MPETTPVAPEESLQRFRRFAQRASQRPSFLGHAIGADPTPIMQRLAIDEWSALRLIVCRQPRPASWNLDIAEIADYVGVRTADLEAFLAAHGIATTEH